MSYLSKTSRQSVAHLTIDGETAGQRLDNFLLSQLKGVPKSYIYRIIRKGEVRVNKGRIKPDYRVHSGDIVRVPPIKHVRAENTVKVNPSFDWKSLILHENSGYMILNKPSGIAVHGGSGLSYGMIEAIRATDPKAVQYELVHRLDKETSGCLVIAKKRSALRAWHSLLREGLVEKSYVCLVNGKKLKGAQAVDAPLKRVLHPSGERMVRVCAETGQASYTVFEPLKAFDGVQLLKAKPKTGRTHQIRVHALSIGRPIAGDIKYGDKAFNESMRQLGLKRLFLHAESLRFICPVTEEPKEVHAPMGQDLVGILNKL